MVFEGLVALVLLLKGGSKTKKFTVREDFFRDVTVTGI